jgi:signal transduction histidine kinase
MFWSNPFFKTLRFKIAAQYTLFFTCLLLICFFGVYTYQRAYMYRTVERSLDSFMNEFTVEYLLGDEFVGAEQPIPLNAVPFSLIGEAQAQCRGFYPVYAMCEKDRRYIIYGCADGEIYIATSRAPFSSVSVTRKHIADRVANIRYQFNSESYGEGANQIYFALCSCDGTVLAHSLIQEALLPSISDAAARFPKGGETSFRIKHHSVWVKTSRLYDGNVLAIGANMKRIETSLRDFRIVFWCGLAGMFLLGGISGWLWSKAFVRGIERITQSARAIQSGNFSERVAHANEGLEIDRLVDAFNDMAEHTEHVLQELRTISDNIAHDLRTPITRMRGNAELSLYTGKTDQLAGQVAEECASMLAMINTMLEITQTDARAAQPHEYPQLDIGQIARQAVELFSVLADEKHVTLSADIPAHAVDYKADRVHIQRLLANLLDNAVKFTPSGGKVSLSLSEAGGGIAISVSDTGCGISKADLPHVFDRFYRADSSRTLQGNGLGLSLVKAIVSAYRGRISIQTDIGKGTTFSITLPR